ncbi:MAG: dephospho-CoA kinase [Desulfobacteraceae bacterium]
MTETNGGGRAGNRMHLTANETPRTHLERIAKEIQGEDGRLLLGVTGGIASGKSTISAMLEELGAPLIDFDIIARRVVEPGQPAYREIVDYFGRQVLSEDGCLDRRKLASIVFRDPEKRKKLESFTHPRIFEEFGRQVNEIAARVPGAVIQAAVPLLLELELQYLFHKILVVYSPREEQVRRLIVRDGISEEEAYNMLNAQLPIEDKCRYADFVIDNSGSLGETKEKVKRLWEKLLEMQKALSRGEKL